MKVQDEPSSEEGFWLKLDMSDRGRYALPSNEDSYDPRESPRDRLLREVWQGLTWYSGKRYTLRVSWSSQFPTDFRVSVHTPESALAKGGIRWRAEKVEEVVQRGGVGVGQDQTSRFDHVTTAAGEVLPSSAGSSKKVEEREEEERNEVGGTRGEDLVVIKKKSFDRGREFEDVVDSRNVSETRGDREGAENPGQQHVDDEDANVVPLFPCDRLYLHISAFETGLRTPTASLWGSKPEMRGFSSPLAKYPVLSKLLYEVGRISELAFANLSPYTTFQRTGREGDGQEEADEEEEAVTKKVLDMGNGLKISFDEKVETGRKEIVIPVHLTLEKLRLGFLPDTCLSMLAALLPLSLLAYLKALPTVVGFFAGLEGGDGKVKVE
ncbi:hypothetical protein IE53DRAFT_389231 [Violaceomyces palustris]|uniref:Uncharacterized protein n=1 Tax=Violaceomyces palustris TaxID=1673888 RepID=A0ACD0NRV0_9BASI|nr:hypothetical protein IE53DRAFT_389231 [Violaceomyces palustris]